jgi:hypothetical protein
VDCRAGRAGQSTRGESFLLGVGEVGGREWKAINALLCAPLACVRSHLLPAAAEKVTGGWVGVGGKRGLRFVVQFFSPCVHRMRSLELHLSCALTLPPFPMCSAFGWCLDWSAGFGEEHTWPLQGLLLEGVASGLVSSPQDIQRLLLCTLSAHEGRGLGDQAASAARWRLLHACTRAALRILRSEGGVWWGG